MDGNGRWAGLRHLPRVEGHRAGTRAVREIRDSARIGLKYMTLYAFSVENWKRPAAEVATLMALLKRTCAPNSRRCSSTTSVWRSIGRTQELPPDVQHELHVRDGAYEPEHRHRPDLALNYGGRAEIVDAVRAAMAQGCGPTTSTRARLRGCSTPTADPTPIC